MPKIISPGNTPSIRCCIYKERAILGERIKIAMGGDKTNPNVIEVMDIACDECPVGGYVVTDSCRGCLAHRCEDACPRNAITFDDKTTLRISISRNASTAVHAQRSVLTPRLPTANVPAKMPAKSRLFPWEKTLLRISIIQSASPAVHAFISVRSARSWINHLSLTRLTLSKERRKYQL